MVSEQWRQYGKYLYAMEQQDRLEVSEKHGAWGIDKRHEENMHFGQ
jgi:hypothetical protein